VKRARFFEFAGTFKFPPPMVVPLRACSFSQFWNGGLLLSHWRQFQGFLTLIHGTAITQTVLLIAGDLLPGQEFFWTFFSQVPLLAKISPCRQVRCSSRRPAFPPVEVAFFIAKTVLLIGVLSDPVQCIYLGFVKAENLFFPT